MLKSLVFISWILKSINIMSIRGKRKIEWYNVKWQLYFNNVIVIYKF